MLEMEINATLARPLLVQFESSKGRNKQIRKEKNARLILSKYTRREGHQLDVKYMKYKASDSTGVTRVLCADSVRRVTF